MIELEGKLLTQWDTDRWVTANCEEVHFADSSSTEALVVKVVEGKAPIPNILLQKSGILRAWEVTYTEGGERTVSVESVFNIRSKKKPSDYVYTETEVLCYESLEKRIAELEKNGGGSGGNITVDSALSKTSTNPVQNKVITAEIDSLKESIDNLSVSGLTTAQVNALDGLFKIATYTKEPSEEYNAFKIAFNIGGTDEPDIPDIPDVPEEPDNPTDTAFTVTRNLTGCTSNGTVSEIAEGSALNETLTVNDGYTLPTKTQGGTITITMGGTDITTNVYNYSTGNINILSVTGNVMIEVICNKEATLPTLGLDDYFDLRNAELYDLGNYKSFKATTGNGVWFGGGANVTTDEKGSLYANYTYSSEGTATWNKYPMPYTFASMTYSIGYNMSHPYLPAGLTSASNNKWYLNPRYINTSGQEVTTEKVEQINLTVGYHTCFITVDESNIMNIYIDNKLIQSYNGAEYDDFAKWISFENISAYLRAVDHLTAFVTWDRALTEEELSEVERYLRTLEVT